MNRTVIKVAGESGMGLASVGAVIAQTLKRSGFHIHSDREYPSLIKGGHSNVQIDFELSRFTAFPNRSTSSSLSTALVSSLIWKPSKKEAF